MWRTVSEPPPRAQCPELPELTDVIMCAMARMIAPSSADICSGLAIEFAEETELKLSQCIEPVRSSPSAQSRCTAAKVKFSARSGTEFRLPVVQVMVNNVGSGTDLVLAVRPANIVVAGEAPVVPESRIPALGIANIGIARDSE